MNAIKSRIAVGAIVRLNSGGPDLLVVDLEWGKAVVAYKHKGQETELTFPYACLTSIEDCSKD